MESLGWKWTPTMQIGSGCTVHLRADELPSGGLVVSVSKHLTAVIDGVIHDTTIARAVERDAYMGTGKRLARRSAVNPTTSRYPFLWRHPRKHKLVRHRFRISANACPVNLRYETIKESMETDSGCAVLEPDTESRGVFAFSGAGGRSAHYFAPWALGAILTLRVLPCWSTSRRGHPNKRGYGRSLSRNAAQLALQMGLEDCAEVSKQAFGRQNHSISRDAQCCAHLRPTRTLWCWYDRVAVSLREITTRLSCGGLPEPPDQTLQLTDSIWQCFYQRGGSGNAYEIYAARDHNASPGLGKNSKRCSKRKSEAGRN